MTRAILVALSLSACVSTTLEPRAGHPSNPDAASARAERATAVLDPGFDPFERYPESPSSEQTDHGHQHHGKGAP